jgi:hypothetical protein
MLTSRLGTGVYRPGRRSRPWPRARRAARRPGNRARCHRRRRVTARRPSSHLQAHTGRSPAQTNVPRASAASTGQECPVNSARRGGVLGGSAGQWPSMELAGRARAQGARGAHTFRPVRPARSSGNQSALRQHGGAHAPAQHAWHEGQQPHKVLAWRRRARGHEWPESSARARRGSSAARRPATRQGDTTAHPNAVGAKQSRAQGGRKGIRWLRWCSLRGGGVVEAGSRTAMARRRRRSRRRTVPCSGPAPSSDANDLLSFP